MKNQSKFALLPKAILIIILLITACTKEDEVSVPPSILIMEEEGYVSSDTTIPAGGEIRLKVLLQKGDLNITNFMIDVYTDSVQTYFDTGMNTSYIVWKGLFIKSLAEEEEWKFIVRDREGNSSSTSLNISLDTNSSYQTLITYSPVTMGAQDNAQSGGGFDTDTGNLYFHYEAADDTAIQACIDLLYFYSTEDKNTLASPGANIDDGIFPLNPADWTIINTSRYIKTSLTPDDFIGTVNDSIILANYEEGEAKRKAKNLKVNDIYTFRTQKGKLGMFMVNEVNGMADGSVNIDIKIQE